MLKKLLLITFLIVIPFLLVAENFQNRSNLFKECYLNDSGVEAATKGSNFTSWLNKGPNNVSVYKGFQGVDDVYAGITNNPAVRQAQHGTRFDIKPITNNLTRNQARAIEQVLIEQNPQYLNKINSISTSHRFYQPALDWAKSFLGIK